jgi:hypothetical protein
MIATTIVLVVSPSLNADGRNAYSTRGQPIRALIDAGIVASAPHTKLRPISGVPAAAKPPQERRSIPPSRRTGSRISGDT